MSFLKKASLLASLTALSVACFAQSAFAVAQDYSDITSGFTAELTAAMPVALSVLGAFVGILLAIKVLRRIIKT